MRPAPNPFWRFSLRTYRAPGVEQACLSLQERCGADVNLLLFCGWTGRAGRQLDRPKLKIAMSRVGQWQSGVIAPLRAARRELKRLPPDGPAGQVAPSFRKRLTALELDLERAEQALLAQLGAQWLPSLRSTPPQQAIAASLECYLGLLPKPATAADLKHVACIAQACSPKAAVRRRR